MAFLDPSNDKNLQTPVKTAKLEERESTSLNTDPINSVATTPDHGT